MTQQKVSTALCTNSDSAQKSSFNFIFLFRLVLIKCIHNLLFFLEVESFFSQLPQPVKKKAHKAHVKFM